MNKQNFKTAASVLAIAWLSQAGIPHDPKAQDTSQPGPRQPDYNWFQTPHDFDAWSPKIYGWQERTSAEKAQDHQPHPLPPTPNQTTESLSLNEKFDNFARQQKYERAQDIANWIQEQAPYHYKPDDADHWATLNETLDGNGDDCDGLALLPYYYLRENGFSDDEIFLAVVYRPDDEQYHMVTLWFDDPSRLNPYVIDPTGVMTWGMPRMSGIPGWVPLRVFSETQSYTVVPTESSTPPTVAAPTP